MCVFLQDWILQYQMEVDWRTRPMPHKCPLQPTPHLKAKVFQLVHNLMPKHFCILSLTTTSWMEQQQQQQQRRQQQQTHCAWQQLFAVYLINHQEAKLQSRSAVITPFKVIQGHWFWYQGKACLQLRNFLLMNNTNLYPISQNLSDIVQYWSTYCF